MTLMEITRTCVFRAFADICQEASVSNNGLIKNKKGVDLVGERQPQ
jgi:hypothetical protein